MRDYARSLCRRYCNLNIFHRVPCILPETQISFDSFNKHANIKLKERKKISWKRYKRNIREMRLASDESRIIRGTTVLFFFITELFYRTIKRRIMLKLRYYLTRNSIKHCNNWSRIICQTWTGFVNNERMKSNDATLVTTEFPCTAVWKIKRRIVNNGRSKPIILKYIKRRTSRKAICMV